MRKSAIIAIIGALLLMTACNSAVLEPQRMGSITLSLSSDVEVELQTKAAGSVDLNIFKITVAGETATGKAYSQTYSYSEFGEGASVPVPFGRYEITAESCTEQQAEVGLGCARYFGKTDVSVAEQAAVAVSIACSMVNAKASLYLDESFLQDFTEPTAKLKVGERELSLIDTDHPSGGQEVYFNVPQAGASLIYTVTGTVAGKSLTYTNASAPMNLKPARWAKITISSNHNGLVDGPDISEDDELAEDSFTDIVNPGTGSDLLDMNLPTIVVNTTMYEATVINCELDVL